MLQKSQKKIPASPDLHENQTASETTGSPPMARPRKRVQLSFEDHPSLTTQQFKEDSDINLILQKASRGEPIDAARRQGAYIDLASFPDILTARDTVAKSQQLFETYPAELREKFQNDPAKFLKFVQDEANHDQLVSLGLATKKVSEPILDPAVPPPAPAPKAAKANPAPEGGQ